MGERENTGHVGMIHLEAPGLFFFFSSVLLGSSVIINSFERPFIIVICSVHCALLAVQSAVGLCHQNPTAQSLTLPDHAHQTRLQRSAASRKTVRWSASSHTPAAGRRPARKHMMGIKDLAQWSQGIPS